MIHVSNSISRMLRPKSKDNGSNPFGVTIMLPSSNGQDN